MTINTHTQRPIRARESFAHIESYYQSGMRPSEYYKSQGISECPFYNRCRRYLAAHPEFCESQSSTLHEKKRFHEVKIANRPPCSTQSVGGMEIHYSHGVKVVIPAGNTMDIETICSLIGSRLEK